MGLGQFPYVAQGADSHPGFLKSTIPGLWFLFVLTKFYTQKRTTKDFKTKKSSLVPLKCSRVGKRGLVRPQQMVATGWNPVLMQAPRQRSLLDALSSLARMIPEAMSGFRFGSPGLHRADDYTGSVKLEPLGLCQYLALYVAVFVWESVKPSSQGLRGHVSAPGSPIQSAPSAHEQKGFWTSGI